MNVLVIHGLHGDIKATYEPYLEKEMLKRNIPIIFPNFPRNNEATYLSWIKVMDEYLEKGILNEHTIVVSRCLGSRFILKYLAAKNIRIKAIISIAAILDDYVGVPETDKAFKDFHVSEEEIDKSINYVDNRYAIYGDKDYLSDVSKLEDFAIKTKSKKIFVPGMGHCGNSSGIKEMPEVVEIIDELLN